MEVVTALVFIVILVLVAIAIAVPASKKIKDKSVKKKNKAPSATYNNKAPNATYNASNKKAKNGVVLDIAWFVLIFNIAGGMIALSIMASTDDDLIALGFAVFAGSSLIGIIVFGILYALGNILKQLEEMNNRPRA